MRENRLIKKQTQDSAYAPKNKMERGHFNYGYGWRTFKGDGHHVVYHTGWWHGFRHIYVRDLTSDVTVVLLSNLTNGSLLRLDELYKMLGMPVIRRGAYSTSASATDTDDD
jgi:CubicO group peptidase (beta-lactamase class C family)